jgi:hypothetical protein
MSTRRISLLMALALFLVLIPAFGCKPPVVQPDQLKTVTMQIQNTAQMEMDALDHDLSTTASELPSTGLSATAVTDIFDVLVRKYPFVIDYATTDADGKMVTVLPAAYSSYEGTDIGSQPVTIQVKDTQKPLLSGMFKSVEGMDAVVIMWPVLSERGDFIGTVSALFKPEDLFAGIIKQGLEGTGIAIAVTQLDGLNIYDSQGNDTGKNLFTDPEYQPYTELIALGHRMVAEKSGSGTYTFLNHAGGKPVKKQAFWETTSLHGTDWRVVGVSEVAE